MSEPKTTQNEASVTDFLENIDHETRKSDSYVLLEMMKKITGEEPKMWGSSLVGFGSYHYVYASGREGDWPLTAFSPRKQNMSVYIMPGFDGYKDLMGKLGKHKTGKSCLYINKLSDVDADVLKELVAQSVRDMRERYDV